jgi:hypothetical protein
LNLATLAGFSAATVVELSYVRRPHWSKLTPSNCELASISAD